MREMVGMLNWVVIWYRTGIYIHDQKQNQCQGKQRVGILILKYNTKISEMKVTMQLGYCVYF